MKDAQNNRDAVPTVQGNKRCNADPTDRRALHQDKGVFQHAHIQDQGSRDKRAKTKEINWNEWNPFVRATGEALRQLNKRQRKQSPSDCVEEALL